MEAALARGLQEINVLAECMGRSSQSSSELDL
jgi:hypothetical protein